VKGRILKTPPDDHGYPQVNLSRQGRTDHRKVHKLVAAAFLGPCPAGFEVLHKDGDSMNAALANLRYGTKSENELDKRRHGTHHNSLKTHCPQNHEYTAENTYINPKGSRECIRCKRKTARPSLSH
jgi:HNH endonuclease